jgi:hypothetical protein
MFLTTFQGTFISFMTFFALNKEKITSLQRFLEAQERDEKEKNHQKLAPGAGLAEPGAEASDGCAIAQDWLSLAQWPQMAAQWRKEHGAWRQREKKPYKGLRSFDGEELFL